MRLRAEQATAPLPRVGVVYATTDVSKGMKLIRKGDAVPRNHPMVADLPSAFEVRVRLLEYEEINDR
jgi:hypothetical protein